MRYPESRIRSCDTVVVAPAASASGRTLFGKNSDRHPNEAQYPTVVPAAEHAPGAQVECTYVRVPQVAQTYRVFGSRPWWLWGFEHGMNEHGVIIGNEALWSKLPGRLEPGLIGMDLLRLTLERARTADEALTVLTGLIEAYGQSGPTNPVLEETYENGFVIADAQTAWLVQTAERYWVATRVETVGAMSNLYTIGSDYTLISDGAIAAATENGWFDPSKGEPFDFAAAFGDPQLPDLASCRDRFERSSSLLSEMRSAGQGVTLEDVHRVLCDLGDGPAETQRPGPSSESAICMYAQDVRGSETAASIVAELHPEHARSRIGVSAGSPRHSTLVPVWVDLDGVPGWEQPEVSGAEPTDFWWVTEQFQRRIEAAYPALAPIADALFATANRTFFADSERLRGAGRDARAAATAAGVRRHLGSVQGLGALFDAVEPVLVTAADADLRGGYLDEIERVRTPTSADCVAQARATAPGLPAH